MFQLIHGVTKAVDGYGRSRRLPGRAQGMGDGMRAVSASQEGCWGLHRVGGGADEVTRPEAETQLSDERGGNSKLAAINPAAVAFKVNLRLAGMGQEIQRLLP